MINYENKEISLREQAEAQRGKIESVYDQMWKIISQQAQVTESYKDSFKEEVRNLLKLMEMDDTIFKSIEDFSSLSFDIDEVDDFKSLEVIFQNTTFNKEIFNKAFVNW